MQRGVDVSDYQIFTDAASDITNTLMNGLPHVEIIPMSVEIDGKSFMYGSDSEIAVSEFYKIQRAGGAARTSGINHSDYTRHFEPFLRRGYDILYLGLSSGLSGTVHSAFVCAETLKEKYPERKIICIDTLCASLGEGFLVREAARMQQEGLTLDELAEWVADMHKNVCQWFTVDVFDHLYKGGRISAAAAAAGTMLQIKPLLHVDGSGLLTVTEKPRGRRRAAAALLKKLSAGWMPEHGKLIIIGHGDCRDDAENLADAVKERFPEAETYITDIGPVIGAHTGPGMLAAVYWGSNR